MSVAAVGGVIHLPFGERPQYGSPYPEGMAVAQVDQAGDASGGTFSLTIIADGGFLYRLEGVNLTRGTATTTVVDYITSHRWATDRSGRGPTAFDLNWIMGMDVGQAFTIYTPSGRGSAAASAQKAGTSDLDMIRRLPMGRTDAVKLQTLMTFNVGNNSNGISHKLGVWFTYWRKESLFQPGFLASFFESPAAPPLIRLPT